MSFAEIHKSFIGRLPFTIVTVGESPRQIPITRPSGMLYNQVIWVKEGAGNFEIMGERLTLGKEEGLLIRAGVPHSYEGRPFHTAWCTFDIPTDTLDFLGIGDYMRFDVPPYLNRETEQLISFAVGESTPISRSVAGYSYMMDLLTAILPKREKRFSDLVLDILERRYSEPLSLADIADELGTDRYALCRGYKQERGVTVMADLMSIRITKAKRFLRYSAENVETVGKMCGFESHSYFTKRFREATGITPSEYRNKNS